MEDSPMSMFASMAPPAPEGFDFPKPLSEKYRPTKLEDFVGVHMPRKVMMAFAQRPTATAWLFTGAPGLGKTSMALALCDRIGGELHHIPSQKCTVEEISSVCQMCNYIPKGGLKGWHVVLVDEADRMSPQAQLALLSRLDATAFPTQTIFIFTSNATDLLQPRFLSRCKVLEFKAESVESEIVIFLQHVYKTEGGTYPVDHAKIARDSAYNVRDCLGRLEIELLMGSDRSDLPTPAPRQAETQPAENEPQGAEQFHVERPKRSPARNSGSCGLRKGEKVVLEPFITKEIAIRANYRGETIQAKILKDGRISLAGKLFNTPTAAAASITRSASAWTFWKYQDGTEWRPIDRLRK
jgi:hypothetical protein